MSSQSDSHVGLLTAVGTAFAFIVSVVYLGAYWSSFGINVFEYVTVWDVFLLSIQPLLYTFLSFMVGVVAALVAGGDEFSDSNSILDDDNDSPDEIASGTSGLRTVIHGSVTGLLCSGIAIIAIKVGGIWYLLAPLLATLVAALFLMRWRPLIELFPKSRWRFAAINVFIAFPIVAYQLGTAKAEDLRSANTGYQYILPASGLGGEELRIIGKAGDRIFAYQKESESVRVMPFTQSDVLSFATKRVDSVKWIPIETGTIEIKNAQLPSVSAFDFTFFAAIDDSGGACLRTVVERLDGASMHPDAIEFNYPSALAAPVGSNCAASSKNTPIEVVGTSTVRLKLSASERTLEFATFFAEKPISIEIRELLAGKPVANYKISIVSLLLSDVKAGAFALAGFLCMIAVGVIGTARIRASLNDGTIVITRAAAWCMTLLLLFLGIFLSLGLISQLMAQYNDTWVAIGIFLSVIAAEGLGMGIKDYGRRRVTLVETPNSKK